MPKPMAHRSKSGGRSPKLVRTANARQAIGELEHGGRVYILTFGQFSLMDAILEVLRQTGPADVVIATWTAANADLRATAEAVKNSQIRSMRWIVDRSFVSRQPKYCATMRELFGDDCIRTARSHCKFVLIENDAWKVVIQTSMNLNHNARLENIEISDDPELFGFMEEVVEAIFSESGPGDMTRGLPLLDALDQTPPGIRTGKARMGR